MNPKPISETEALRSDIELTRRRMDETINALGERVQGRHLLDEVLGFFRNKSDETSDTGARVREKLSDTADKISQTASSAANAVVDTVKKNPLPVLLITAGAAWLAYNATRKPRAEVEDDLEDTDRYDPDTHYDRPLDYPGNTVSDNNTSGENSTEGMTDQASSAFSNLKDKAASAADQAKEKLSEFSDKTRETFESVKQRASEFGDQVQTRSRELYGKTRDTVVETTDRYPLQVGLGCLAVGVLIGLALPTPEPVNRVAGPAVDRLRNRTRDASRDMLAKGKRVVKAAADAAKNEAEQQGLTLERLRQSGKAVANQVSTSASESARQQGLPEMGGTAEDVQRQDPSSPRPAM